MACVTTVKEVKLNVTKPYEAQIQNALCICKLMDESNRDLSRRSAYRVGYSAIVAIRVLINILCRRLRSYVFQ